MDKIREEALKGTYYERIPPNKFNDSMFRYVNMESRKDKAKREIEKLIRKRMRELPKGTELKVLETQKGMFNDVYVPGTIVTKISMAKHFICVKLPDGLITQMHYKMIGTDDIQVTRKLLEA